MLVEQPLKQNRLVLSTNELWFNTYLVGTTTWSRLLQSQCSSALLLVFFEKLKNSNKRFTLSLTPLTPEHFSTQVPFSQFVHLRAQSLQVQMSHWRAPLSTGPSYIHFQVETPHCLAWYNLDLILQHLSHIWQVIHRPCSHAILCLQQPPIMSSFVIICSPSCCVSLQQFMDRNIGPLSIYRRELPQSLRQAGSPKPCLPVFMQFYTIFPHFSSASTLAQSRRPHTFRFYCVPHWLTINRPKSLVSMETVQLSMNPPLCTFFTSSKRKYRQCFSLGSLHSSAQTRRALAKSHTTVGSTQTLSSTDIFDPSIHVLLKTFWL